MASRPANERHVLAFLNEVAGGRKLLGAIRIGSRPAPTASRVAAPQNQPIAGQIVNRDEVRDAARSRVEVTQGVLARFRHRLERRGLRPRQLLALDDAVRAFQPTRS